MNKRRASRNISGVSEGISESIKQATADEGKLWMQLPFSGKSIAISVSRSDDLAELGLSEHHVKDLTVELARYLLVNGATLLYGGDLRQSGYTEIFAQLAEQYTLRTDEEKYFINYFPFPNSRELTTDVRAKFQQQRVEIKELKTPKHLGKIELDRDYKPFESIADRYIFAECFADMRIAMAADSDARIVVGGPLRSYLGYFPGIVEEAYYTLRADKPLFVVGGFGGAAARIANVTAGQEESVFENGAAPETDFVTDLREYASQRSAADVDRAAIDAAFSTYDLKRMAKQTGLNKNEADILLGSVNIHEIVFLIVKGLQKLFPKN